MHSTHAGQVEEVRGSFHRVDRVVDLGLVAVVVVTADSMAYMTTVMAPLPVHARYSLNSTDYVEYYRFQPVIRYTLQFNQTL